MFPLSPILEKVFSLVTDPIDRFNWIMSKTTLTDGSPVTPDHREIDPKTGMQKAYVVLSEEERKKGFVRPVRRTYVHTKCGSSTTMGQALAETTRETPTSIQAPFVVLAAATSLWARTASSPGSTTVQKSAVDAVTKTSHNL